MSTEFYIYDDVKEEDLYVNKSPEEQEKIRIMAVEYAIEHGNKPSARKFNTYPSSVRKWRRKFEEKGIEGLKRKY